LIQSIWAMLFIIRILVTKKKGKKI